jgi:hypothetical protein
MSAEGDHDRYVARFRLLGARFIRRFDETFQRFSGRFRLVR